MKPLQPNKETLMIAKTVHEFVRFGSKALCKKRQGSHDREESSKLLNKPNKRFELELGGDRSGILRYL
jgi:hypothetical protein